MLPLSERLRATNQDLWDSMQSHRFVRNVEADTLGQDVFHRYLVYERGFVETAILIFGHALLKAPSFAARRWLCGVLYGLGGPQLSYFDRAFNVLAAKPDPASCPDAVTALNKGTLRVAQTGEYLDILVVMLAAEWMYATWCRRANQRPSADPLIAEWVQMHAGPEFGEQASWLMAEVDAASVKVDDASFTRLSQLFGEALRLELCFHSAAYEDLGT